MMPILQIGPLAIQVPGLLVLLGVWLGSLTLDREAIRGGLPADRLSKLVFYSMVAGLAAARVGYALRYLPAYLEDPLALVSLQHQTLSLVDGVAAACIFAWVYGRRAGLPLWRTLDALTPMAAIAAVFLALSNFASGDGFGAPASVPWAVDLWGESRHPSQAYETLAALGILAAVWRLRAAAPVAGALFLAWVAMASGARLFLEAFRGDSVLVFGSLRAAQLVGLALVLIALSGLRRRLLPVETAG